MNPAAADFLKTYLELESLTPVEESDSSGPLQPRELMLWSDDMEITYSAMSYLWKARDEIIHARMCVDELKASVDRWPDVAEEFASYVDKITTDLALLVELVTAGKKEKVR